MLQNYSRRFISSLFGVGRPLAIFWIVWAVVFLPLNGVFAGWPLAHIEKKILEGLPSITNGNSTPTVSGVGLGFFIQASSTDTFPYSMLSGSAFTMRNRASLLTSRDIGNGFLSFASAAFAKPPAKYFADKLASLSANTSTRPVDFIIASNRLPDYSPVIEIESVQIDSLATVFCVGNHVVIIQ